MCNYSTDAREQSMNVDYLPANAGKHCMDILATVAWDQKNHHGLEREIFALFLRTHPQETSSSRMPNYFGEMIWYVVDCPSSGMLEIDLIIECW